MSRPIGFAVTLAFVSMVMIVSVLPAVHAAPESMVQVGQVYVVVQSCAVISLAGNAEGRCFGEIHRVTAVRDGQWVDTVQCEDEACQKTGAKWRLNLNNVYAFRPMRAGTIDAH